MQYLDLAFLFYLEYYVLASILLVVTVSSAFVSTAELCKVQKALFKSIDEQRLIPLVQSGRVRCGHKALTNTAVSLCCEKLFMRMSAVGNVCVRSSATNCWVKLV